MVMSEQTTFMEYESIDQSLSTFLSEKLGLKYKHDYTYHQKWLK